MRFFRLIILALIFLMFNAIASPAQNQKISGPLARAYFSDYGDSWSANADLNVYVKASTKGTQVYLSYSFGYTDWSMGFSHNEFFSGPIPASALQWSGEMRYDGNFTVTLDVDTSTIDSGTDVTKEGNGGPVQLSWTLKPMTAVTTSIGPTTVVSSTSVDKYIGTSQTGDSQCSGSILNFYFPEQPWNWSYFQLQDLTLISHSNK